MMKYLTYLFGLLGIFLFFATYGGLTATPKFWHDEAVPFEIARNIAEFGKADLAVAPNVFWKKSFMTHATGFPLTFPLAGIFKIFGVGVAQSRLFMIAWMIGTLAALFFVIRAFFDKKTAFFSVLLVATFSSFYANGRTSTGEIPGFFFLLIALYFLYQKEWYGWGGFFAALAAVTKPSMYLFVLPVIVLEFLISANKKIPGIFTGLRARAGMVSDFAAGECRRSEGEPLSQLAGLARKVKMPGTFLIRTFLGALPVLLFWLWLINPAPFSMASWQEMIVFYQNAFNAPSLLSQFPAAIPELLTHSTLIYFGALLAIIIFAWWRNCFNTAQNRLVRFLFLYGAFSFFYFLRSPGWFRYLLGTELLILALLPAALMYLTKTKFLSRLGDLFAFNERNFVSVFFILLVIFQSLQYLLGAEIPSGTKSIATGMHLNDLLAEHPSVTIGIIDNSPVAALIPADRKIQRTRVGNNAVVGIHPLSLPYDQLPTYLINTKKDAPYTGVRKMFYKTILFGPFQTPIYKKTPLQSLP